jgi:hypothetical protein
MVESLKGSIAQLYQQLWWGLRGPVSPVDVDLGAAMIAVRVVPESDVRQLMRLYAD